MVNSLVPLPSVRFMADGVRYRPLCRTIDYVAALVHYPAGVVHPNHEHDRAQLTFLLCGGFADDWEGRQTAPTGSLHGHRPEGARHACRFGRNGALILSINFVKPAAIAIEPAEWWPTGPEMVDLYALLFARTAQPEQVIDDLIAAIGLTAERAPATLANAPAWLRSVAQELTDDPLADIASVADRAGVHRVYVSRAFQKHLGISPTHFRLHCKSALALRHMIEGGESPSVAAVAAGFADQAHWTRASRAVAGVAPAKLRRLLAA